MPLAAVYLDAPLGQGGGPASAPRRPRAPGRPPDRAAHARHRAARGGRGPGQVIALTGEPGIGKTRLVQESRKRFIAWVGAGSGRRPLWLEGRVRVLRVRDALWPVPPADRELDRRGARPAAGPDPRRPRGRADPPARQHEPARPARVADGPARRAPAATAQAGPARRKCSGRCSPPCVPWWRGSPPWRPTVLVLEDLHWADPTSLRLTAELAELARDRPLLLIATSQAGPHAPTARAAARPRDTPSRPRGRRGRGPRDVAARQGRRPAGARRRARERRRQPAVPRGAPGRDAGSRDPRQGPGHLAAARAGRPRRSRSCSSGLSGPGWTGSARPPATRSGPPPCSAPSSPPGCSPRRSAPRRTHWRRSSPS